MLGASSYTYAEANLTQGLDRGAYARLRVPGRRAGITAKPWRRSHGHGLLAEAQKEIPWAARVPSIETKRELIQVIVQVLPIDRTFGACPAASASAIL